MTAIFRGCGKLFHAGRWRPALLLMLAFGLSGCQGVDGPKEGLRKNDLSAPARQVRATDNLNKEIDKARESKGTDDFMMSPEAKNIYHNMD